MQNNIILNTDSYKVSMWRQYPEGTSGVFSYIESRGGLYDNIVVFGLQGFIQDYLTRPITQENIDEAEEILLAHGEPFNREGWQYILEKHNGHLPLSIKTVAEGSVIPIQNVIATVENTDPKCFWLTTYLETAILRAIWYPTTVATQSKAIKDVILDYLERTGDPSLIDFKLHDFGSRGVSSEESAAIGGAAHLVNFKGSDTISGLLWARKNYSAGIAGFSIPAAEHSTITSWGRENEAKAYENMLKQFAKPGSIVAVVSDSYDVFNACDKIWGTELKQKVIDSGATIVIRPDSGDPETVCGRVVDILGKRFGFTVNEKGYKVLNNVRIIQGDGVNATTIRHILGHFEVYGWSADNIAFGMGGALLQQIDRDTQKFAMKCSAVKIDGKWVDVQKDPITDPGKKSKAGLIDLWTDGTSYVTSVNQPQAWSDKGNGWESALVEVYRDGVQYNKITFDQVRANSNKNNKKI